MNNIFCINTISPISVSIVKSTLTTDSPARKSTPHIHDCFEIYVNLTGNVSFIVEKNLYSIQHGDIIIVRPYEYHQCIYNDESDHAHYWITFSADETPELFAFLNDRNHGDNLVRMPGEMSEYFISLCEIMLSASPAQPASMAASFLNIISYLEHSLGKYNISESTNSFPQNINEIIRYINKNFASIKNIRELADTFHISIATLERYFRKHLSMTPHRYLENKKLSNACILLRRNASVTDACFESGFDDYSHFISIFRKNFHTTPLKYKKEYIK